MVEKYGVDNPGKMEGHIEKCINTNLDKYGVLYAIQDKEKQILAIKNMLKTMYKYGTGPLWHTTALYI